MTSIGQCIILVQKGDSREFAERLTLTLAELCLASACLSGTRINDVLAGVKLKADSLSLAGEAIGADVVIDFTVERLGTLLTAVGSTISNLAGATPSPLVATMHLAAAISSGFELLVTLPAS